jgi:flagellar protein FliO/FliZ
MLALAWTWPVQAASSGALAPAVAPLRIVISLAVVVALIGVLALILRRLPGWGLTRAGELRLLGTMAVGSRERVVLMEIGGSRILLGVAPGRVQTLHILPAEDGTQPAPARATGRTEPVITATGSGE